MLDKGQHDIRDKAQSINYTRATNFKMYFSITKSEHRKSLAPFPKLFSSERYSQ